MAAKAGKNSRNARMKASLSFAAEASSEAGVAVVVSKLKPTPTGCSMKIRLAFLFHECGFRVRLPLAVGRNGPSSESYSSFSTWGVKRWEREGRRAEGRAARRATRWARGGQRESLA